MDAGGVNATSIATNVWSSASRTLTSAAGLTVGQKLQPFTTVTGISLTGVASTAILNYSATGGVLLQVGIQVTTAVTGTPTVLLDVIQDGNTMSIPLYTGVTTFDNNGLTTARILSGNGASIGNFVGWEQFVGFATSIVVQVRVTSVATAGALTGIVTFSHP